MSIVTNIKSVISRELNPHEFNSDGHYKYTNSPFRVPNFIARKLGVLETRPDRRVRHFGRIRGNIFAYMTLPMFIVFGLVIYAVGSNMGSLIGFFETNIYLNGLIISLAIFGLLKTFHNSFLLYKAARFVRFMEAVLNQDKIEKEDIYKLRRSLEKHGILLNTVFMTETLNNIEKFGNPNFNDTRARLIKSKLGYRVAKNKGNVSFISGLLVMLGLLGTFLGLLGTIDAVGGALNSMSNIGGESGEVGVEEMTGFISSLSAPLQGMGLAFSSSLFGLSGSMLIGFFLYLQGTPQNAFIENFSRWIDDRIGTFDPNLVKKLEEKEPKIKVPAKDADLKDWLTGFVHLSVKTNHQLSELSESVTNSTQVSQQIWTDIRDLFQSHSTASNAQKLNLAGEKLSEILPSMNGKVQTLSNDINALSKEITNNQNAIAQYFQTNNHSNEQQAQTISVLKDMVDQSNSIQKEILNLTGQSAHALSNLNDTQINAATHTKDLVAILQSESNIERAGTLVQTLNAILKDFNDKMQKLSSK